MSATNRLIDETLKHMERNRTRRSNWSSSGGGMKLWETQLEALAQAADRERGEGTVLVYVRPEDFADMHPDKACGYLVDHIMSQLTPEQQAIFQDK